VLTKALLDQAADGFYTNQLGGYVIEQQRKYKEKQAAAYYRQQASYEYAAQQAYNDASDFYAAEFQRRSNGRIEVQQRQHQANQDAYYRYSFNNSYSLY